MFRKMEKSDGYLFSSKRLYDLLEARRSAVHHEVEMMDSNRLLNLAPADLTQYLIQKYSLQAPVLLKESWSLTEGETQIDVSRDSNRYINNRNRPFYVPGQTLEIEVPFDGEAELFYVQAATSSSMPPRAQVRGNSIFLTYNIPHDAQSDLMPEIERMLQVIEQHIEWVQADLNGFNQNLPAQAEQVVTSRRFRLLANQGRAASLGIPMKSRSGAPQTYAVPEVRRKIVPTLPQSTKAAFEPEPILDDAIYEHILSVVQNMTLVMERSPTAFRSMGEEDLRQHFLMQLNGQFEGGASGETFNVHGKTDILLRANGKNVFIAECKFWKGPKQYLDTIDQLLGYTAWRDTKTAIFVFNRGTAMSTVIERIAAETKKHKNFKRTLTWPHESGFRYVFHHTADASREFVLTVLVFDVPATPL